jgi:phytol kinase
MSLLEINTAPLLKEIAIGALLLAYVFGVVYLTKPLYDIMRRRGFPHNVAVYYNRKVIHVFAGGVVALLVPIFFASPIVPGAMAALLALATYLPHRTGKLMEWFQVRENMYEVNFCVMWGISVASAWILLGDPVYALVPIAFMAFGDAATGFTRNLLFKRRTKSWIGNMAMFAVSAPVAYALIGVWGMPIAAAASIVEHFEFGPIDDNVLVSLTGLLGVALVKAFA